MKETLQRVERAVSGHPHRHHRLFSRDVRSKVPGSALVVDEEQRFGVSTKEKMKERLPSIGCADPVRHPSRTPEHGSQRHQDMSTPGGAPADRLPVQTYVLGLYNWPVVADAMRRELERGGQILPPQPGGETIDPPPARIQGC